MELMTYCRLKLMNTYSILKAIFANFAKYYEVMLKAKLNVVDQIDLRALKAAEQKKVIDYVCHAGLVDFAAPVFVDNKCVATVFCGQRMPQDKNLKKKSRRTIIALEEELGCELLPYWLEADPIKAKEKEKLRNQLDMLTQFLSDDWKRKIDYSKTQRILKLRVEENVAVRTAFTKLNKNFQTEDDLWNVLSNILKDICDQFEAAYGCVIELGGIESDPILKASANLPKDFIGRSYPKSKDLFLSVFEKKEPIVMPYDYSVPETLCFDIADWITLGYLEIFPDDIALWPIHFGNDHYGVLVLFTNKEKETNNSLAIEDELHILEPFTGQISTAFTNFKSLKREREFTNLQSRWLQDVIHEVEQPIHGILGYAEVWRDDLLPFIKHWHEREQLLTIEEIEELHDELESILWMALNASQVARNFAWLAGEKRDIDLSIEHDLAGTLIAVARDKQGQAKERSVFGPNVKASTISPFNGKVYINRNLFKQAIRNLLDNAVKYANPGTKVIVEAKKQDSNIVIQIIDIGLPILPGEEAEILGRRVRGKMARESNIGGAGIGLAISKEIIELHKGHIKIVPSETVWIKDKKNYKTIIEVILPLI